MGCFLLGRGQGGIYSAVEARGLSVWVVFLFADLAVENAREESAHETCGFQMGESLPGLGGRGDGVGNVHVEQGLQQSKRPEDQSRDMIAEGLDEDY